MTLYAATLALLNIGVVGASGDQPNPQAQQEVRENIRRLQRSPGGNTSNSIEEYEVPEKLT